MKFTPRGIEALKAKTDRYEVWENNQTGLGLRIAPSGRKTWLYMYRFGGKARRMTLGAFSETRMGEIKMSLADAHEAWAGAKKLKETGTDPGTMAVLEKTERREADTIEELVTDYLVSIKGKRKTHDDRKRALKKDVLPAWGKRKAVNITRRDVIKLVDKIGDRGSPIQANRTFATIRRIFNWAISKDIVSANPCLGVEPPGEERQRDRVLSEKEIQTLWNGLPKADMAEVIMLTLKFQLVTLQRKGEITAIEKSEIEGDVWTIPAEKAKNGLAHRVPLSAMAKDIMEEAKKLDEESEWLFPSPRSENAVTARAVDHALRKAITSTEKKERKIELDDVRPHDLRRTGASIMTSMGIPRLTVSKILNHAESGVTSVYDRHSYDPEKTRALDAWSAELTRIIEEKPVEDNVIRMGANG